MANIQLKTVKDLMISDIKYYNAQGELTSAIRTWVWVKELREAAITWMKVKGISRESWLEFFNIGGDK